MNNIPNPDNEPEYPYTMPDGVTVYDKEELIDWYLYQMPVVDEEEVRSITPFDLLNSSNYTTREKRDERLDICSSCPRFFKLTKSCRECGCFMGAKAWLKDATCPREYWI